MVRRRCFPGGGRTERAMTQPHGAPPLDDREKVPVRGKELLLQDEQRLLYVLAFTCLPFWFADCMSLMRPTWDTLALRGVWALATAGLGLSLQWVKAPSRRWLRTLAGVGVPNLFLGLIIHRLGGEHSPLFGWYCVMPVVALPLSRNPHGQGWMGTLAAVASASAVMAAQDTPLPRMLTWVMLLVGAGAVGAQMNHFFHRLWMARVTAEEEHQTARQELAESHARALEAERMAQVGRLAAGVAHEVKNPLAYVQANLRFLLEEWRQPTSGASDSEYTEALQETMQGVERIHQIVKDLTAMSRAEDAAAGVGRCELAPVIDASVRLASVRLKSLVKLSVEVPPETAVLAEPRRLGQVLLNLLLNAADAIEEARVQDGRVAVRVEPGGPRVRLLVEDNGPGIQAENLSRLFTTFFTTKGPDKGTGLGLALSRQYVESFGGTLHAENRAEGGARFIVDLPSA